MILREQKRFCQVYRQTWCLPDKAYDAYERVIQPLCEAGIEPVIPAKANRKQPRPHDKDLYTARSLIENFFWKLKQFRAITTRYDKNCTKFPSRNPTRSNRRMAQLMTRPNLGRVIN